MIKLKDISKFYYSETTATLGLRNVNLEFEKGEFVAITGESGSGKSTLLNVISGMDTYEDGELYYNGEETSAYSTEDWDEYRRNKISLIYQSYNLIDSYTALENIESVILICEKNNGRLTDKERRKRAMECLKMVGLEKQAKNKASHMSSGQKQRLGIARALAKNTDVLIADEPTGNLDIENGKQVMQILHELSKTKLVIVVTHNYEQAEPYATRKVRLFDSEVVENRVLRPKYDVPEEKKDPEFAEDEPKTKKEEKHQKDKFDIAHKFVKMNRRATPHRNFFVFSFMLMSALAISLMVGIISKNMDDSTMRIVSHTAFMNVDKTRLVVKNIDGSELTAEDAKRLAGISKVQSVDLYGGIADVSYYYLLDEDYKVTYKNESLSSKSVEVTTLKDDKFMKSSVTISQKDLKTGRLPEKYNEVVIYSSDESVLDTKIAFYFKNWKHWGQNTYAAIEMKVVGILKAETQQAYFSPEFCEAMSVRTSKVTGTATIYKRRTTVFNSGTIDSFDQSRTITTRFFMNPELSGNTMKVTQNQFLKLKNNEKTADSVINETITESGLLEYRLSEDSELLKIDMNVVQEGHYGESNIVEISPDLYWTIYSSHINEQMTVYIDDYAYTDEVLKKISDAGYEAISAFKTSAVEYDAEKIAEQFKLIGIGIATIVIIFVLFIFVVYSLMKLKRADFIILTSLGMSYRTVRQMNYYDLITMIIVADIISFIIMNVLSYLEIQAITDMITYVGFSQYMTIVVISVVMAGIAAALFSRHLLKKFRITALKGE